MTSSNVGAKPFDVYDSRRKWKNPSGTKTYYVWRSMRHRCLNPKNASWKHYGGRGIAVCEKWANDYDAFFQDMGEAPAGMSLERLDVNKGYFPENCVWATDVEQGRNRRNNKILTHNGKTMCLSEWAEFLGIGTDTLCRRLNVYKMPINKALTQGSLALKWKHGTRRGYEKGCKCAECRGAHAAHHRAQRARRKERSAIAGELAK
jgi:hypothetical protein